MEEQMKTIAKYKNKAGVLLDGTNITFATIFVGLIFFILFVLTLDYMRTRIGLKPEEYDKKDIELE